MIVAEKQRLPYRFKRLGLVPPIRRAVRGVMVAALLVTGCSDKDKGAGEVPPSEEPTSQATAPEQAGNPSPDQEVASEVGAILNGNSGNVLADPAEGGSSSFETLSSAEQGLELEAAIANAKRKGGKDQQDKRKFEEAIRLLRQVVKADPKHGRAFLALGEAHSGLGQHELAVRALEDAINAAGDSDAAWVAEAYRLLGYAIREAGGASAAHWTAWESYLERATEENDKTREVQKLLIPLRNRYGEGRPVE